MYSWTAVGPDDVEDVGGSDGTGRKRGSCTHVVILLHEQLFRKRNEIFLDFTETRSDGDLAVTAFHLAVGHLTVDFSDDSGVTRVTCLEELGYTGETTGDVTRTTRRGTGNLDEYIARLDLGAFVEHQVSAHRERDCLDDLSVAIDNVGLGNFRTVLGLDDDLFMQT